MFLKRIQVHNFRALKDVDITFEPEFSPRIFPLGSLNGGGKSTLLQLIFILLSCAGDRERHVFLQNMLDGFEVEEGEITKPLATIYLWNQDLNQDIELQFICHQDKVFIEGDVESSDNDYKFSQLNDEKKIRDKTSELEIKVNTYQKQYVKLKNIKSISDIESRSRKIKEEFNSFSHVSLRGFIRGLFNIVGRDINNADAIMVAQELGLIEDDIIRKSEKANKNINQELVQITQAKENAVAIMNCLSREKKTYICNYTNTGNTKEYAILCKSNNLEPPEVHGFLQDISSKIFLAAPFTQVFLFLSKEKTKLLFKEKNAKASYYSNLEENKKQLSNLFTYDLLSVDYIIDAFKDARDRDFKQAIETGEYGDCYKSVLNELNSLLGNKKINIDIDLSGVSFTIERDGETKELYPEDLSHGELKRLSIYVWLKYKKIEDSIVLIDEIENAFHPDWQYQIILDLGEWGKSNQYILATHSYELCQALTPAHVKELEPRLPELNKEKQN